MSGARRRNPQPGRWVSADVPRSAPRGFRRSRCTTCGKDGWWGRADAKAERRRLGGSGMHVYRCWDDASDRWFYHVGHQAPGKPREAYRAKAAGVPWVPGAECGAGLDTTPDGV